MSAAEGLHELPFYKLRLLVAGSHMRSRCAVDNLRRVCDQHLSGRFDLEIIDVYERPEMAQHYQVVALPTLVKLLPLPVRRIIGDLSAHDRVLRGLELAENSAPNDRAVARRPY
jgi:circadian clock protein KaiB